MRPEISTSTVRRLSAYYRVLRELRGEGVEVASSTLLAERSAVTPAQLRKDLSCFGHFGTRGRGYDLDSLTRELRSILGLDRRWRVGLVGAGNVGSALFSYAPFREQGFDVVAIYDSDPAKIGQVWDGVRIAAIDELRAGGGRVPPLDIAVLAVPAAAAQDVSDLVVAAGVRAILNFAPRPIAVPPTVALRTVDMAIELEALSFALRFLAGGGGRAGR